MDKYGPKAALKCPEIALNCPKVVKNGTKRPQNGTKCPKCDGNGPKRDKNNPEMHKNGSNWSSNNPESFKFVFFVNEKKEKTPNSTFLRELSSKFWVNPLKNSGFNPKRHKNPREIFYFCDKEVEKT